jgi:U3 small nucleolar RNA-associated protein 4
MLYQQTVRLPDQISRIAVSLLLFNGKQYLSGIRFIPRGKPSVLLGYIIPEKEIILDVADEDGNEGTLTGFISAVGPSGIHAVRATLLDGHLSAWAGRPEDLPMTLRLCMQERVTHLKGGFDVRIFVY